MTLFPRLFVLAAALPAVFATGTHTSSDCKATEFYWGDKSLCIPYGGYPNAPSPPKGTDCPKSWSWHSGQSCCVPQTPPPSSTPSCTSGWSWDAGKTCCLPHASTTSKPAAPTPSPSQCKGTEFYWGDKSMCIPYGGFPNPPSPPKGSDCPSNWSWHTGEGCCIPHQPPTTTPPTCGSGWGWDSGSKCCLPHTSTSTKPPGPTPTAPSDCKPSEWWWDDKSCCLPHGGTPNPPQPPSGSQCPSNWEWHTGKGCCVPQHPNPPPPQCGSGWGWDNGSKCCFPHGTTPTPTPSSKPGTPGHGHYKRAHKARNVSLCPTGLDACPIAGLAGLTDDWECLDTRTELESCGGCASTGAGQDCTAIPGAWNVGCNNGKCVVYTCAAGYLRSLDNKSCVKV
ncbi:hypothetical protein C8Q80DRAFT_1116293 [Daedaleopsis nitida]|nr:hypothetical protein C8Q80DRAFT_1116293 [Daedaleopsis nitida]